MQEENSDHGVDVMGKKFKKKKKGEALTGIQGLDECPICHNNSVSTKSIPNRNPSVRPEPGDKRIHECKRGCGFRSEAIFRKGKNPNLTPTQQEQIDMSSVAASGYWDWNVAKVKGYRR